MSLNIYRNLLPAESIPQDTGASEMVADGRIKVKSDSELESFTENGVLFKDGSKLEADVIILATG